MRIGIIGAGAMGCMHAVHLGRAGHQVTLIETREEIVAAINRDGLHSGGVRGDHRVHVSATTPALAQGPFDLVILLCHTDGTPEAATLAARCSSDDATVVTLQNGIGNVEALEAAVGPGRTLGGISYNSVAFTGPGRITHTNRGPTLIGALDGARSQRVEALAVALEEAGFETKISGDIMGVIWNKFVQSCAIHALCALTGLKAGEIASVPEAESLRDKLLDEALAVADAKGITLSDADPIASVKRISSTVMVRPSMLQHLEQGRATEIDSQNGALVREGRALGIATPCNEALTLLVKAREKQSAGAGRGGTER